MVALEGDEPVAVLLGCKRPPDTLIRAVAVHPDHVRKGHARHLLTSLEDKLAILGPPHLVAEIPADDAATLALFESCGFREEARFADLVLESPPLSGPAPPGAVSSVTVADLDALGLLAFAGRRAWERTKPTLLARADRLRGLAVATDERVEASVLYTREDGGAAIWSVVVHDDAPSRRAFEIVVGELARREGARVRVPAVSEAEAPLEVLEGAGLERSGEIVRVGAQRTLRS